MIYFTSDYHFGHRGIIKYRPQFSSLEEMEELIIKNHNKTVKPNDTIYILGDFISFYDREKTIEMIKRLNGRKIWIVGNHDSKKIYEDAKVAALFEGIYDFLQIRHNKKDFVLCHYPFESWKNKHHGAIHLFGHVHNNTSELADIPNRFHVGVDENNFTPVSIDRFF